MHLNFTSKILTPYKLPLVSTSELHTFYELMRLLRVNCECLRFVVLHVRNELRMCCYEQLRAFTSLTFSGKIYSEKQVKDIKILWTI